MTSDMFDDWDDDFQLTILCQPNLAFYLPDENFPSCKSWCPAEKPVPPGTSKMYYVNGSDPKTREAWSADRYSVVDICVVLLVKPPLVSDWMGLDLGAIHT